MNDSDKRLRQLAIYFLILFIIMVVQVAINAMFVVMLYSLRNFEHHQMEINQQQVEFNESVIQSLGKQIQ